MPLRALVDGREVQVRDLTGREWSDLRRRGRAGTAPVLMACCGRPGLAKTSRNGNPFFAHRSGRRGPAAAPCRWAGESAAHALCKLLAAARPRYLLPSPGASRKGLQHICREALGEDLASAQDGAAAEAPDHDPQLDAPSAKRKVGCLPQVAALNPT